MKSQNYEKIKHFTDFDGLHEYKIRARRFLKRLFRRLRRRKEQHALPLE